MANATFRIPGAAKANSVTVDGTKIDLSAGATNGQALRYNGTSVVAATLGSSFAIGSTITTGTTGSVLFVDGSTNLGQNNSSFFWDNTHTRLGIGTSSPNVPLEVRVNSVGTAQTVGINLANTGAASISGTCSPPKIDLDGYVWQSGASTFTSATLIMYAYSGTSNTITGRQGDSTLVMESFTLDGYGDLQTGGLFTSSNSWTSSNKVSVSWTNITLQNSWTTPAGGTQISCYKDAAGMVHLRGSVKNASGSSAVTFGTLPTGYRPLTNLDIGTIDRDDATSGTSWLQIHAGGTMYATGAGAVNTYMYLDGVKWMGEG